MFCLGHRRSHSGWRQEIVAVTVAGALLIAGLGQTGEGERSSLTQDRPGILSGMPCVADLGARTFVDDVGRKICLTETPTRIVSLAPSITETLYALGLGDLLVGVTPYCNYPPEAQTKPKVGYSQANIEAIVGLQPDLVLAHREFLRTDVLGQLDRLTITTFILDAKTIDDIPSHIQIIGRMLDRTAEADRLAMDVRQRIAETTRKVRALPRPRLLYVLNSQPLITVGPGSFIHHMIELAGGTNVAAHAKSAYPRLNMEEVLKEDPEIIVFPVGAAEGLPDNEQQLWQRWTTLSAVKRGRFHRVPADLLNRPGPRIVQGLEALARILHPEAFDGRMIPR